MNPTTETPEAPPTPKRMYVLEQRIRILDLGFDYWTPCRKVEATDELDAQARLFPSGRAPAGYRVRTL